MSRLPAGLGGVSVVLDMSQRSASVPRVVSLDAMAAFMVYLCYQAFFVLT